MSMTAMSSRDPLVRRYELSPGQRQGLLLYRNGWIYAALLLQFAPLLTAALTGHFAIADSGGDLGDTTDASANTTYQVIAVALFINSLVVARSFKVSLPMMWYALLPVALIALWMVLSVAWSAYPLLTVRRASRELIEMTTAILLGLSMTRRDEILRLLFRTFFIINLLDLVSIAVPSISFTTIGFAGIHVHKSTAGLFFFLAIPIFMIGVFDRAVSLSRVGAAFALFTAAGMCILSQSKSAVGVMLISIMLVTLSRIFAARNVFSRIVIPLMSILFVASLATLIAAYGVPESLNLVFGDATLTGRDQIWRYTWNVIDRHPMNGVGYGALWQIGPDEGTLLTTSGATWIPNQAHNGYLDVLAQLGTVGLILLALFMIGSLYRAARFTDAFERRNIFGPGHYALFVLWGTLLYNVTETSFLRPSQGLWFMLIFVAAFMARQLYRPRQRNPQTTWAPGGSLRLSRDSAR
jgi:O-antigen ligase